MENLIQFLEKRLQKPLPFADIKNEDIDENLKTFITQSFNHPPFPHRICAVMIVFFEENGQIKIPFIVRPMTNRVHPGQVAFPGGGQEEQDESLTITAIRETIEEVGVTIPQSQIIGKLSNMYVPPSNSLITPIVGFLNKRPIYHTDPKEVARVLEIALDDLMNEKNHVNKEVKFPQGIIQMPAIQIGEQEIWGATARILKELVAVLKERN